MIIKIVLTGGPCAGKTTALARITQHFGAQGFKVFTVPEVPTMITQSGWDYLTPNRALYRAGEIAILKTQLALEEHVMHMASTCDCPCLVVCDRGAMDVSAYIERDFWEELLRDCHLNEQQILNNYDAVLHLVSAANGAEMYYQTESNANRYEQANEEGRALARKLDHMIATAWSKHPHFTTIHSEELFEDKMRKMLDAISVQIVALSKP